MTDPVRLEAGRLPGVLVLTMAEQERRNALGAAMVEALDACIGQAVQRGCRSLILRAEPGARTWSAGFAIDELPKGPLAAWPHPLVAVTEAIRSAPMPVIAAVEGGAWGGGCEVALTCDLIVATTQASFALTPARLGVAYDAAALARLAERLPRHVLAELLLTAQPMSAQRLESVGVVNAVVAEEDLDTYVQDLAGQIASLAPLSISAAKAVLADLPGRVAAERAERAWTSRDYREGLAAFAERRPPDFTGV